MVRADQRRRFHALLREGFLTFLGSVRTIHSFLTEDLRIPPDYVSRRVSTILLNGKPVDGVDTATVSAGATIALSAALPGIAGACMRKGGRYSVLRSTITNRRDSGMTESPHGLVRVKLFNLVSDELGPLLLSRGVMVETESLCALLGEIAGDEESCCTSASIDGRTVDRGASITDAVRGAGRLVMVSIVTDEEAESPSGESRREGFAAGAHE